MNVSSSSDLPDHLPDQGSIVARPDMSADNVDTRMDRFRRGFERLRGVETPDDEKDLELEVLLLREENARLKAELHRPSDVGTMIASMRRTAAEQGEDELSDEPWGLLSDSLVIQEELTQACEEIKTAMSAVQQRLARLTATIQLSNPDLPDRAIQVAPAGLPHGVLEASHSEFARIVTNGSNIDSSP